MTENIEKTEQQTLDQVLALTSPPITPSVIHLAQGVAVPADVYALDELDRTNAKLFVAQAMAHWKIDVRYDGALVQNDVLQRADTPETVAEVLVADELDIEKVADQLVLVKHIHGYEAIKTEALKAALRDYCRKQQNLRRKQIMAPLLRSTTVDERNLAMEQWRRLNSLFDLETLLPSCVIQHFVWQVKQKVLGRTVTHHLTPIIYSSIQGSGKTTFVRRLLEPIQELASADTLLSDFADKKSGTIYRNLVVAVDDMEFLPKAAVPALKSLITAQRINRRKVHTNQNMPIRQRATLIGTANAVVEELISDETGHRRFVTLPFCNGDVSKGGDPAIWEVVSQLDYKLLWLSVDAFGPCPIAPHLRELHEYQQQARPVSPLLAWLRTVDVDSSGVKGITTRYGVKSDALRELYVSQTSTSMSRQKFKEEMMTHLSDSMVPFAAWREVETGKVWTLKARLAPVVPAELGANAADGAAQVSQASPSS